MISNFILAFLFLIILATLVIYKKLNSKEYIVEKFYCENHPNTSSVGACIICEDVFCEQCLINHGKLVFCKEHVEIFTKNKWKQITNERTTPDTPEDGLYIYQFKRHLWRNKQIPSFVQTHYEINIEENIIESFIRLNVLEESEKELLVAIEKFKARNLALNL